MRTLAAKVAILWAVTVAAFGQANPPTINDWTALQPHGPPVTVVQYDKAVYVDSLKAMCWLGVYGENLSTEPNHAINCHSYKENRYFVLNVSGQFPTDYGPSAGHSVGLWFYEPTKDSIIYITDASGSNVGVRLFGRMSEFNIAGMAFRDFSSVGTDVRPWLTANTYVGGSCRDSVSGKTLVFPLTAANGSAMAGLFDPSTNSFTATTTTNLPPAALSFSSFDCADGKAYVYGGGTGYPYQPTDTLYVYNFSNDTWHSVLPATRPGARIAPGFACSTVDPICLMAGGTQQVSVGSAWTDTWIFNRTTETWSQVTTTNNYYPHLEGQFDKLRYDPDSNVFIFYCQNGPNGYADGTYGYSVVRPYVFAYSTALNWGRVNTTYTPTTGSLNATTPTATSNSSLGSQSFAYGPSLSLNGLSFLATWSETSNWFASGTCNESIKVRAKTISATGTVTNLATNPCSSLTTTNSGAVFSDHSMNTVANGTLWEFHQEWYAGFIPRVVAKAYVNGAWTGGAVGFVTAGTSIYQDVAAVTTMNGEPYVAVIENDHLTDKPIYLYVKRFTGGSWQLVGTGKLNNSNSTGSEALGATLVAAGTNLYACWNEAIADTGTYRNLTTNPQIFCRMWDGSSWSPVITGSTLNRSSTAIAGPPSGTYKGSALYVGWTERTPAGVAKLNVISWTNNTTVTLLGGTSINIDNTNGYAYRPSLANDGTLVYAAWVEQASTTSHAVAHVKSWNNSAWSVVGSAIAADGTNGNVGTLSLVSGVGIRPTLLFSEMIQGNMRQIYVRQWDGASWSSTLGSTCPSSPSFVTTAGTTISESSTPTRPAVGGYLSDSTFGNCMQRVSDGSDSSYPNHNPVHAYSKLQPWNADGSKLMVNSPNGTGFRILDAATFATVKTFEPLGAAVDPRWSPTDPDVVYYIGSTGNTFRKYSVANDTNTILHTFSEYTDLEYLGYTYEEISRNGRWVLMIGSVSGTPTHIFAYDIVNDVKGTTMPYAPAGPCSATGPDWAVATDNYAVIQWPVNSTGRYCGIESYNLNTMAYVGKVGAASAQHEDLVVDSSGVEWVVQFDSSSPRILKQRIPSGYDDVAGGDATGIVNLLDIVWGNNGHISCRSNQPFCLVSGYNNLDAGGATDDANGISRAYERELYKVWLDSTAANPHIERVAHTRSWTGYASVNCADAYWIEPRATLNRDGTKALFSTSWGANCTADDFTVALPASNSGPTVPTVTTTSATSITATSAVSGGNVVNDGGATVTARGVACGTSPSPTTVCVSSGTGTGTYTSLLTGLTASTTYYYRAFATNSAGTTYGSQLSFTTGSSSPATGKGVKSNRRVSPNKRIRW